MHHDSVDQTPNGPQAQRVDEWIDQDLNECVNTKPCGFKAVEQEKENEVETPMDPCGKVSLR
jgi:hypothetical protein